MAAVIRPAPAAAQFAAQPGIVFAALDGGTFTTGLAGPGLEGVLRYQGYLFSVAAGGQFVDYGRVNVAGLLIEPRLMLPDTDRVHPYVGLRGIAARFSYAHQLGTATGTGSTLSVGFGVDTEIGRRAGLDVAFHYLVRANFGESSVNGTRVDNSPITGHGGGAQLRAALTFRFGRR